MKINEFVLCAKFGDPRSRDCELARTKTQKMVILGLKIH